MNRFLVMPALSAAAFVLIAADAPPQTATAKISPPTAATPKALSHRRWKGPRARASRPVAAVASANRAATIEPVTQGFVNAVQVFPYADGLVFQAYTAPGRITDIALQIGETLVSVASGDTVRWVIGDTTSGTGADKRTHVLVKPFASGLATNLVITTDRRSYHLALTSIGRTAMAALSWTYPQDALIALKRAAAEAVAATPVANGLEIDQLRFDYAITGDKPA